MRATALFPHLAGLHIDDVAVHGGEVSLTATAVRRTASCPLCHRRSRRVHSRYHRRIADLPVGGCPVTLHLRVRRFFCPNPRYARRIFAERLPVLVDPGGRRSHHLRAALERVAFALGGEAGTRLASALGMPTTPDVLLRLIRTATLPEIGTPERVGVDDFALRKGRTYAGLVVDLDARRPLDVLPDCTATTIATWLAAHPSIRLVTRDRGTAIVEGVTRGAPQATQVADRWHLLKNLGDVVERLLVRERGAWHDALVGVTTEEDQDATVDPAPDDETVMPSSHTSTPRATQAAQEQHARRTRRIARYEEVRLLHRQGWSGHAIARTLHLSRTTVQSYLTSEAAPILRPRGRKYSKLDPYKEYLARRWQEGCHNAQVLFHEVRRRGYTGGHSILREYVAAFRQKVPCVTTTCIPPIHVRAAARPTWSPRQLVALLMRRSADLTQKQEAALTRIQAASPMLVAVYEAVQTFAVMVREREVNGLTGWVETLRHSEHRELRGFAEGLLEDYAAVRAGLTVRESNGPTEGQINKLKLVKRSMYGRGKVDLLRQRVVWRG